MKKAFGILALGSLGLIGLPGQASPEPSRTAPGSPPGVQVVDLARAVADIARDHADKQDVSRTYYGSAAATVHMHVLGFGRKVGLHIHRGTEEATVIVTGTPHVSLAFAADGKRKTIERAAPPGFLIHSPPFTGHEWLNPDRRGMQANLVFASPPFDGNVYLEATDPRVLRGGEPLVFDPGASLRAFLASGKPFRIEPLPMQREKMVAVLVRDDAIIPAHPTSPTLIYVTNGEGDLLLDREYPLRQQLLINVPPHTSFRVRAKQGAPLVLIAFRPEA